MGLRKTSGSGNGSGTYQTREYHTAVEHISSHLLLWITPSVGSPHTDDLFQSALDLLVTLISQTLEGSHGMSMDMLYDLMGVQWPTAGTTGRIPPLT